MAEEAKKTVKKEKIPRVAMPEQEPAVRALPSIECQAVMFWGVWYSKACNVPARLQVAEAP